MEIKSMPLLLIAYCLITRPMGVDQDSRRFIEIVR